MKVLFIGEFSNVHLHLKEGLEKLGHEVLLITHDGGWRKYYSDVKLTRKSSTIFDSLSYLFSLIKILPQLKNFDVVQINNPVSFFQLKAPKNQLIYDYLKRRNKKIFMAGYSTDYFWIKACVEDKIFRYSEFMIGEELVENEHIKTDIREWTNPEKKDVNIHIAHTCDGIVTCLYEYYAAYINHFPDKTTFIPLPINISSLRRESKKRNQEKIKIFIGIQKQKNQLKGTDIMLKALERVHEKYPDEVEVIKAESVPYLEYEKMINSADVLLDQLYSYTPAMNALMAMAKGIVVVGGGEPENYEIIHETQLRPIINVLPCEEDVYNKLEWLVLNKNEIPRLSEESIEYVKRHHDHVKVAQQYVDFWESK